MDYYEITEPHIDYLRTLIWKKDDGLKKLRELNVKKDAGLKNLRSIINEMRNNPSWKLIKNLIYVLVTNYVKKKDSPT